MIRRRNSKRYVSKLWGWKRPARPPMTIRTVPMAPSAQGWIGSFKETIVSMRPGKRQARAMQRENPLLRAIRLPRQDKARSVQVAVCHYTEA